jgi:hypothetical protein
MRCRPPGPAGCNRPTIIRCSASIDWKAIPELQADGTMKRDSLAFLATMVIDLYLIDHMPGCIG